VLLGTRNIRIIRNGVGIQVHSNRSKYCGCFYTTVIYLRVYIVHNIQQLTGKGSCKFNYDKIHMIQKTVSKVSRKFPETFGTTRE
jgi:hypothetical protein